MATNVLKQPKYLDILMGYIQKNDKKSAEGLIEQHPMILNEKCLDDLEPIFFVIRNKCNKLFKLMLEKMVLNEDLIKNIYISIKKDGTPKMFKAFLDFLKINDKDICLNEEDEEILSKVDDKNSIKMNIEAN